jgi:hypothetical protein
VTKFGFFDIKISGGLLFCVFSQNLECLSQKMSLHAHFNFELSKDLAASIFEPQPQNVGQA